MHTRTGSYTIKAESIFLNLKYPKELNDSIIAISLRYDHTRLRKVCLADFSVEITSLFWLGEVKLFRRLILNFLSAVDR